MNPQFARISRILSGVAVWLILILILAQNGCTRSESDLYLQMESPETVTEDLSRRDLFQESAVQTGAEVLIRDHLQELDGVRVGLVMNPTARIDQVHMLDTLLAAGVGVTALFAPEHGFRGESGAGEVILDGIDQGTGLPVYSLYGEQVRPGGEMLEQVDLLIFDMQDVGARFYTYISTLGYVLEGAAEQGVPVWVLDRPNPVGGDYVSGWILEEEYHSFVGRYPIPIAHGMTLGELGAMMIGENWIEHSGESTYRVIPMRGWERSMKWPDTGLSWFPPSPNLPMFENALVYLGTCLIEGTTLSEGRGTDHPFLLLGSPETSFDHRDLDRLQQKLPGLELEKIEFTPRSIPGQAPNPKHEGEVCTGIRVHVTDYLKVDPVESGLLLMTFLMTHSPRAETLPFLYRLAGTEQVGRLERAGESWWDFDTSSFESRREKYLLYE